ncbi:MAG TPA: hypothetical protein VI603_18985 [Saprospiraceae bacterium]|nr:hypothetical protein [Saprospiraceae bacterium]
MGKEVKLSVAVFLIREGEYITAYSPHLEISGYGKDADDAMLSFDQCVEMFLEESIEKGNLHEILLKLGWKIQREGEIFSPPQIPTQFLLPMSIERRDKLFRISA